MIRKKKKNINITNMRKKNENKENKKINKKKNKYTIKINNVKK